MFASTGGGHQRTDDRELNAAGEGGGGLNDTDREEVKEREDTGKLQGTGNPGDSGRGRKTGGPDHHRTVKIVT